MSRKMKPFAFLGYEKGGDKDAIIVKLPKNVKIGDTVKLKAANQVIPQEDPPSKKFKGAAIEILGFAKNPSWHYINGKWYYF